MAQKVKILVECPALIASVRVGVLEPLRPLQEKGLCEVNFLETRQFTAESIAWCDVLITVRGSEFASSVIVKEAKRAGRFVVYFLDDDLLHIPTGIHSSTYFQNEECKTAILNCLKNSNVLWCVNPRIGEKYAPLCSDNWILSSVPIELSCEELPSTFSKGKIKVLYAGSVDHSMLVQKYLSSAVKRIANEMPDQVEFLFIGAEPNISAKNVKHIDFIDSYEEYKRIVNKGNFSIGLAVIDTSEFYRCKYYNKFIEYSSLGAVGIYTNVEPYSLVVQNGKNGFLCENTPESWYETLKQVILKRESERRTVLNNAVDLLRQDYTLEKVSSQLAEDIPQLTQFHAPVVLPRNICIGHFKLRFYLSRVRLLWNNNKLLFFPILVWKVCKVLCFTVFSVFNNFLEKVHK